MYVTADERVEIAQFNVAVTANLAPIPSGVFPKQELAETHIVLGKADFAILLPTLVSSARTDAPRTVTKVDPVNGTFDDFWLLKKCDTWRSATHEMTSGERIL